MLDREQKLAGFASELSTCLLAIEEHRKTIAGLHTEARNVEKALRTLESQRRFLVQKFAKIYAAEFKED